MEAAIQKLLEAIDTIVSDSTARWDDKVQTIRRIAHAHDETNLSEFLAWFDGDFDSESA